MNRFSAFPCLGLSLALLAFSAEPAGADRPAPTPRTFAVVGLANPRAVAVDASGNLYVGDVDSGSINKITPAGIITLLGGGQTIKDPIGLAVDRTGAVFVADADGNAVYKILPNAPAIPVGKVAAGSGETGFSTPTSVAVDAAGNLFVTDNGSAVIRKVAPAGTLTTFAGKNGQSGSADGLGSVARFATPRGIAIDGAGNLYVADEGNDNIRKITPRGEVSTLAGGVGLSGHTDGSGTAARFAAPRGIAADAVGNVFVADTDNHAIRKITPSGVVTTLAGKAEASGNADGIREAARFNEPRSVAVDAAGNVYVADTGNGAIRMITPTGVVTTVAGASRSGL